VNIFQEVLDLNFPENNYVVVGSGILVALGLKEGHDVDIVVTTELFEKCGKEAIWEQIPWTYPEKIRQIFLRKGLVELYLDVNCGKFNPTFEELLARATTLNNVAFASLEDTLKFKKEYVINNHPKHIKDIETIKEYLKDQ